MLRSRRLLLAVSLAVLVSLLACATAPASPIVVKLRVEGSSKTLFEGPIATEAIPAAPGISTKSSAGAHPCNVKDNGGNEGFGAESGTPTTALYDAAVASGLAFDAGWSSSLHDFFVTQVGPDMETGAPNFEAWGYAVNYTTANVGGCQFQLAPGSEVLWAYNYFNLTHLLSLTGPASANAGSLFTVHIGDGRTGEPIAEATIGEDVAGTTTALPGASATDAAGNATITLSHAGVVTLKATRADSVRSGGLAVCVHNGNDGTCGTTLPGAPSIAPVQVPAAPLDVASVAGVVSGHVYSRRHAPRILRGLVQVPAGGTLREVRISLQRLNGRRCQVFDGARESFMRARCGTARFFSVGGAESFSYLLPAPLPAGRYVYDIEALDAAGHATKLIAGVSQVGFRVR